MLMALSERVLLFAHDIVRPEDSGDHLPVKLASAKSNADTVRLATRIVALAADQVSDEREACAWIAQEVQLRALGNTKVGPRGLTLDQLKERDWKMAGQQHAAGEIAFKIRGRSTVTTG